MYIFRWGVEGIQFCSGLEWAFLVSGLRDNTRGDTLGREIYEAGGPPRLMECQRLRRSFY